jgi:hypothetical protein
MEIPIIGSEALLKEGPAVCAGEEFLLQGHTEKSRAGPWDLQASAPLHSHTSVSLAEGFLLLLF